MYLNCLLYTSMYLFEINLKANISMLKQFPKLYNQKENNVNEIFDLLLLREAQNGLLPFLCCNPCCLQANSALYNQSILLAYNNTLEEELKILEMGRGRSVCVMRRQFLPYVRHTSVLPLQLSDWDKWVIKRNVNTTTAICLNFVGCFSLVGFWIVFSLVWFPCEILSQLVPANRSVLGILIAKQMTALGRNFGYIYNESHASQLWACFFKHSWKQCMQYLSNTVHQ